MKKASKKQPSAPTRPELVVALQEHHQNHPQGGQAAIADVTKLLQERVSRGIAKSGENESSVKTTIFVGMTLDDENECWQIIGSSLSFAIELLSVSEEPQDQDPSSLSKDESEAHEYLKTLLSVADSVVKQGRKEIPADLAQAVFELHDALLRLNTEKAADIQEKISSICEEWFIKELPEKERLAPQTISFLMLQSLRDDAKIIDIKRVHALRKTLLLLDFSDQSSDSLKNLILYTFMNAMYLQVPEGRKFLVFCLGLHVPLIDHIYQSIKNQIPGASKTVLESYGEVLYKAWSTAGGPYLQRIEYSCIQDLMNHAIHAPCKGANSMASKLKRVVGVFHAQKAQPGVDEMLHRLYEPIIWRSLKVANPMVRRNSAALMVDAFPLQDPELSNEEIDALLQKQFDAIQSMLQDPCSAVRQVGIEGVCHIFARFWELIPVTILNDFLNQLIDDLAFDASDLSSRVAVLQGLKYLMENTPLSHSLLKKKVHKLATLLHDSSERVRVAFLDLLLEIKSVPEIKFWDIVDIPQLLLRLELDGLKVAKQIVSLLSNSFFPQKKGTETQVERCLAFLEENPESARRFYFFLPKFSSGDQVLDFTLKLYETVHQGFVENASEQDENVPDKQQVAGKGKKPKARPTKPAKSQGSKLSAQILERGLETVAISVESLFAHTKEKKEKELVRAISEKFQAFPLEELSSLRSPSVQASIMALAAHLSGKDVSSICDHTLSRLKSIDSMAKEGFDIASSLRSVWSWGQFEKIQALVVEWLDGSIVGISPRSGKQVKKGKQGPLGKLGLDDLANLTEPEKPTLALKYLDHILGDVDLRASFLPKSERVVGLLSSSLNVLDLLTSGVDLSDVSIDDGQLRVLGLGIESLAKLEIHRRSLEDIEESNILDTLVGKLDANFLSNLFEDRSGGQKSKKRKASSTLEHSPGWLAVVESLQKVTIEFVTLGLGETSSYEKLLASTSNLLLEARGSDWLGLVPHTAKLVYQLNTLCHINKIANKDSDAFDEQLVEFKHLERESIMLITHCCSFIARVSPPEDLNKNLRYLRPVITELIASYSDRMNLSEIARPLIQFAFGFKRSAEEEVSPVLDFFYEIFSSRSDLIAQAFAAEMLSLLKTQIAYDELTADSGDEEQDWVSSVDKIFDFVTHVITSETLKVKKPTFEKFRAWLAGIETLTKGRDKKQLAGLDQEHRFKKGFLRHASTLAGPLLQKFAAGSQPPANAATSAKTENSEDQAEE